MLSSLGLSQLSWEQPCCFHYSAKKKGKKKQNTHLQISGQNTMQAYLTVPKTILKTEDNHIIHQLIPQANTDYSLGTSAETIKTRGKQENIHSSTNATN